MSIASLLATAALSITGSDNVCVVNCQITNVEDNTPAYMIRTVKGYEKDTLQRSIIKDGKCTFRLDSKYFNEAYEVVVGGEPSPCTFLAECGTVSIVGKGNEMYAAKASGTKSNDQLNAWHDKVNKAYEDRNKEMAVKLSGKISESQKKAKRNGILKKYDSIIAGYMTELIGDGTSLAGVYAYWQTMKMYSVEEIDATLTKFKPSIASTKYYLWLKEHSEMLHNTSPGALAPKFTALTPDGSQISIDDMRGKYFILDFWASWCRPCRAEGKNIKTIYEQLRGKNFDVLSISSDQSDEAWRKAMEEDAMEWMHGLLVGDNQKKVFSQYGITGIPAIWVIDPEGKIIAKQLRGNELKKFCLDLFRK